MTKSCQDNRTAIKSLIHQYIRMSVELTILLWYTHTYTVSRSLTTAIAQAYHFLRLYKYTRDFYGSSLLATNLPRNLLISGTPLIDWLSGRSSDWYWCKRPERINAAGSAIVSLRKMHLHVAYVCYVRINRCTRLHVTRLISHYRFENEFPPIPRRDGRNCRRIRLGFLDTRANADS